MDLLKRRDEVLEGCRAACATRGSGWHPGDAGAEKRDAEPALPARPVVLQDNDRMHVVGPDVAAVKAALERFLGRLEAARKKAAERGWDPPDLLGHGHKYQDSAVRAAKKVLAAGDALDLFSQEWNYANALLQHQGVHVVSATAEVQSYD